MQVWVESKLNDAAGDPGNLSGVRGFPTQESAYRPTTFEFVRIRQEFAVGFGRHHFAALER